MRLLIAAALLAFSLPALSEPVIAVSMYAAEELSEPQLVLPIPEEGQTISAGYPEAGGACDVNKGAHKVQQWVPVRCPPPVSISLTRAGDLVKVKLGLSEYQVSLNANASAVESVALEFKNFEPSNKARVRIETVMHN